MAPSAALVGTGLWLLLFRKIPSWTWFGAVRSRFPRPLETLWSGWTECAYCGGFWISLAVRAATTLHTIDFSPVVPAPVAWFLDALATAVGILLLVRILDALAALTRLSPGGH